MVGLVGREARHCHRFSRTSRSTNWTTPLTEEATPSPMPDTWTTWSCSLPTPRRDGSGQTERL
jgi:hypothetical protein